MSELIDTSDGIEVYDRLNNAWRPWCPDCAGMLFYDERDGQIVGWADDLYDTDGQIVGDLVREPLHIAEGDTCWSCATADLCTTWTGSTWLVTE